MYTYMYVYLLLGDHHQLELEERIRTRELVQIVRHLPLLR